jgi:hypothetical protein
MSAGYAVFLCVIGGLAFTAGCLGIWYFGSGYETRNPGQLARMVLISFGFAALGAFLIASVLRSQVTLRADAIVVQGIFSTRTLPRDNIAGRRLLPTQYIQTLVLVPHSQHQKKLKLALALRTDPAFVAWFTGIPDLDAEELANSEAELSADPDLGFHSEDRKEHLRRAKHAARVLTGLAWIASLWGWFFPRPYNLAILILVALPLIAIVLQIRSRGIYQMEGRRNDARPSLAVVFLLPGLILDLRVIQDLHLLRWAPLFYLAFLVALGFCWLLFQSDADMRGRPWSLLLILLFGSAFCGGALCEANALLDHSAPQNFSAAVTGKHISSGKSTTYYLNLDPWGPQAGQSEVSVPANLYHSVAPGDNVCISLYSGALRAPWYAIDQCH